MVNDRTLSGMAGPLVGGALLVAVVWTIVTLAPIAAERWFGF